VTHTHHQMDNHWSCCWNCMTSLKRQVLRLLGYTIMTRTLQFHVLR